MGFGEDTDYMRRCTFLRPHLPLIPSECWSQQMEWSSYNSYPNPGSQTFLAETKELVFKISRDVGWAENDCERPY